MCSYRGGEQGNIGESGIGESEQVWQGVPRDCVSNGHHRPDAHRLRERQQLLVVGHVGNQGVRFVQRIGRLWWKERRDCRRLDRSAERRRGVQPGVGGPEVCGQEPLVQPDRLGAGVTQFIAGQVDFAGSDSPLSKDQVDPAAKRCQGNPAWNLPLVFGPPVALGYNLPGVDKLVINADVLAKIFTGAITNWNDPAIAALNSGVSLPDQKITPIYRSDSSGTTDNFQKYLAAAAPQTWSKGAGKEFQGGAGEGAQKSAGVVQAVQATPRVRSVTSRRLRRPGQADRRPDRHGQRPCRAERRFRQGRH